MTVSGGNVSVVVSLSDSGQESDSSIEVSESGSVLVESVVVVSVVVVSVVSVDSSSDPTIPELDHSVGMLVAIRSVGPTYSCSF